MTGRVVAITGPAAVGKSTIARRLQAELGRGGDLWLVMELDHFARGLSRNWIAVGERRGRFADRGFAYVGGPDDGVTLTIGPDGRRLLAAFHAAVAATARSGLGVICETIVYDEADWDDWRQALAGTPSVWVRLTAPVEALEAREQADRTRALQGLGRGMLARPAVGAYDLEADTTAEGAEAIAERIAAAL